MYVHMYVYTNHTSYHKTQSIFWSFIVEHVRILKRSTTPGFNQDGLIYFRQASREGRKLKKSIITFSHGQKWLLVCECGCSGSGKRIDERLQSVSQSYSPIFRFIFLTDRLLVFCCSKASVGLIDIITLISNIHTQIEGSP